MSSKLYCDPQFSAVPGLSFRPEPATGSGCIDSAKLLPNALPIPCPSPEINACDRRARVSAELYPITWLLAQDYLANPTTTSFDVTHGGVNFRTYINVDQYGNPYVGNVHPIK